MSIYLKDFINAKKYLYTSICCTHTPMANAENLLHEIVSCRLSWHVCAQICLSVLHMSMSVCVVHEIMSVCLCCTREYVYLPVLYMRVCLPVLFTKVCLPVLHMSLSVCLCCICQFVLQIKVRLYEYRED